MATYVGSGEASRLLGVTKPTLYAYVSRGMLSRRSAVDGRTSLYDRVEVERLAARSRRRPVADRPTIDVQVASSVTTIADDGVSYRGRDAAMLAETSSFEQVAELLWTGELPEASPSWAADPADLDHWRAVAAAAGPVDPVAALALAATALAARRPGDDAIGAARRLLALAPSLLGGRQRGSVAYRLASAWRRRPPPELVSAVDRALVLLADHELATSTLAVRVAASVRTDPYSALAVGLGVVRGPLHGAASAAAADLFTDAGRLGPEAAVRARVNRGEHLPGFGHSVYRRGDPRFGPLLAAVHRLPAPDEIALVDEVLAEAGRATGQLPNVDLALGALIHAAGLPPDAPLLAVARIAGWAAHYAEELAERPLRYRGLSRAR